MNIFFRQKLQWIKYFCCEKIKPNLWNCCKTYSWFEGSREGNWKNTVFHFTNIIFLNRINWQHGWIKTATTTTTLLNVLICPTDSINIPRKSIYTTVFFLRSYLKPILSFSTISIQYSYNTVNGTTQEDGRWEKFKTRHIPCLRGFALVGDQRMHNMIINKNV